jgi:hypothetical protein
MQTATTKTNNGKNHLKEAIVVFKATPGFKFSNLILHLNALESTHISTESNPQLSRREQDLLEMERALQAQGQGTTNNTVGAPSNVTTPSIDFNNLPRIPPVEIRSSQDIANGYKRELELQPRYCQWLDHFTNVSSRHFY